MNLAYVKVHIESLIAREPSCQNMVFVVLIATCLLIAFDTDIYAIMFVYVPSATSRHMTGYKMNLFKSYNIATVYKVKRQFCMF